MNITEAKGLTVLSQLRRAARTMPAKWPTDEGELPVVLRLLSSSEVQDCHAAAVVRFNELRVPIDVFFASLFEEELSVQLLYRAVRRADDPSQHFAASAADIRDNTTPDQRNFMVVLYNEFAALADPDPRQLGAELYANVMEAVKKKDRARLRAFGSSVLASFLLITESPPST